jgi:hypothetical protein
LQQLQLSKLQSSFITPGNVYDARGRLIQSYNQEYTQASNYYKELESKGPLSPAQLLAKTQTLSGIDMQRYQMELAQVTDSPEALVSMSMNAPSFYARVRPTVGQVAQEYSKNGRVNPLYGFANSKAVDAYNSAFGANGSLGGSDVANLPGLNLSPLLGGRPGRLGASINGSGATPDLSTIIGMGASPDISSTLSQLNVVMQSIYQFLAQGKNAPPQLVKPSGGPATTGNLATSATAQRGYGQSNFPGDSGNGLGRG